MLLTLNQFEAAVPYVPYKRLELILPNFNSTCEKYFIGNQYRIAHFLTQLIVESNYFRLIQELGTGKEYEGLLGNTTAGDGRRYIGRGYLKIRGKTAYEEYKAFSSIDVASYPHFVTTPKVAMDIAGWIWAKKGLNEAADEDNIFLITKAITGDYLIIRERENILMRVRKALQVN